MVISISIHALREEGDCISRPRLRRYQTFLSTPSARRATCSANKESIEFPNFYPRPPRGGRRDTLRCYNAATAFLSTPSARRATHLFCH